MCCVMSACTSQSASPSQNAQPIDLTVDTISSQSWPQGGGIYRVIMRNTEIDPCLTLESIKYGGDPAQLLFSKRICGMRVGNKDYDFHDVAAISYTDMQWNAEKFQFKLEDDVRTGSPSIEFFDCTVQFSEKDSQLECASAK